MKDYWLCAYGHVVRVSERADDKRQAARLTFGVTDRVTTLRVRGKGWSYKTVAEKRDAIEQLGDDHYERTGNKINGFNKTWYEVVSIRSMQDKEALFVVGPFDERIQAINFETTANERATDGVHWYCLTWFGAARGSTTKVMTEGEYKRAYPQ